MKVDFKNLVAGLHGAKAGKSVELNETEPYLIEAVFEPCFRGVPPKISDLDYGRFELMDLRVLCDYYERWERASGIMRNFNKTLCDAEPKSLASRAFC